MRTTHYLIVLTLAVACGRDAREPDGGAIAPRGPCDIYAAEGGPCVAAHSTVRALLGAYAGPLYQVRRADGLTQDIGVLGPGGPANAAAQDAFCGEAACTIAIIYDQSGQGNHLTNAEWGPILGPRNEADAKALPLTLGGAPVYGEHNAKGIGYRNTQATGTATGDDAETIYLVVGGDYFNAGCCFTYGNASRSRLGEPATMEAVYFGAFTALGSQGAGGGPWVMGHLGDMPWAGNASLVGGNPSLHHAYVVGMVKGGKAGENRWTIKAGDAQAGTLSTVFEGPRPNSRYVPMKKGGAIVLGLGDDDSAAGEGNFFEGLMTAHYSSDAADAAVLANLAAAGYGR